MKEGQNLSDVRNLNLAKAESVSRLSKDAPSLRVPPTFSPVQRARKFSAALGALSANSRNINRPTASPPTYTPKHTVPARAIVLAEEGGGESSGCMRIFPTAISLPTTCNALGQRLRACVRAKPPEANRWGRVEDRSMKKKKKSMHSSVSAMYPIILDICLAGHKNRSTYVAFTHSPINKAVITVVAKIPACP